LPVDVVIDRLAHPPVFNQPCLPQDAQMMGHGGLRDAKALHQLTYTSLACLLQGQKYLLPGFVRKRFEDGHKGLVVAASFILAGLPVNGAGLVHLELQEKRLKFSISPDSPSAGNIFRVSIINIFTFVNKFAVGNIHCGDTLYGV